MITINVINGEKEREFTQEELNSQIAIVNISDKIVLFQSGDEKKYNEYKNLVIELQNQYVTSLSNFFI
jgi:hypothetical protein